MSACAMSTSTALGLADKNVSGKCLAIAGGIENDGSGSESLLFVNTYDEFEPLDECAPHQEASESGEESDVRDGDDEDGVWESGSHGSHASPVTTGSSSPVTPGSMVFGARDGYAQPYSPNGLPVWTGGSGQFFPCPVANQQVPIMTYAPPPSQAAPAPRAAQRPPACPAHPPGSWIPREQAVNNAQQTAAQVDTSTGQSIRLLKAMRPPAPLRHNKCHPVTSLTINHLPFQMRRTQLCALLDDLGFAGRYDYLYVPCNRDMINRGHAFINLNSPEDACAFFAACHGARMVGVGNDSPVLSLAVSTVQGFEASIRRWTVAKMLSLKNLDFRPFIAGMTL